MRAFLVCLMFVAQFAFGSRPNNLIALFNNKSNNDTITLNELLAFDQLKVTDKATGQEIKTKIISFQISYHLAGAIVVKKITGNKLNDSYKEKFKNILNGTKFFIEHVLIDGQSQELLPTTYIIKVNP